MNGKIAAFILVLISIILVLFILASIISITISIIFFAAALVILGIISKGFKKISSK